MTIDLNEARVRRGLGRSVADAARVLCLVPTIPTPADTGGRLRTLGMIAALDKAFDVTVLAWQRDGDDAMALRRMLRGRVLAPRMHAFDAKAADLVGAAVGRPLGYQRYAYVPRMLREFLASEQFDVIHFDHPHTAIVADLIAALQPRARMVLDAHNVEAEIVERLAVQARGWRRPLMHWHARRVKRLEQRLAQRMDLILTCSERDAEAFQAFGARRVQVVPNGVPPVQRAVDEGRTDVVFVGSLDWKPNADAAFTLAREVWPLLRGRLPGARLVLVGRNPPAELAALAADDVLVTGGVESVAPYLAKARVTAVPLRAGSGTRIKILEAWAAGVPVVATRIAAEGLPYTDGRDLLLAESPAEIAAAVERVFRDAALFRTLRDGALVTVEPFYPAKIAELLAQKYREMLAGDAEAQSKVAAG